MFRLCVALTGVRGVWEVGMEAFLGVLVRFDLCLGRFGCVLLGWGWGVRGAWVALTGVGGVWKVVNDAFLGVLRRLNVCLGSLWGVGGVRSTCTQTMRWRGEVKKIIETRKLEKRRRKKVAKIATNRRKWTKILGNLY